MLPFETLRTEEGRYLIDSYEISYVSTGRDLRRRQAEAQGQPGEAVVLAAPAFELTGGANTGPERCGGLQRDLEREQIRFGPLAGTRREAEHVGRRLGVSPWLDEQVLKGRLKQLRSPWVWHAATHGYFLSDCLSEEEVIRTELYDWLGIGPTHRSRLHAMSLRNPMLRSGLALAGSQSWLDRKPLPEEAEDGLLTAEDVATAMDLRSTEMVVLSACDTGMGEVRHGEGVFGLRRGFLLAGAKTLVMSLWKVNDLAAALLMDRFYENLLERRINGREMGRSEALREAQRYLRREVTVGSIRGEWLNEGMIAKLAGGDKKARAQLERWRDSPDELRPFREVFYWGAFILQGESGPLRMKSPASTSLQTPDPKTLFKAAK